eukprot:CAMPEP_0185034642 /NCGR_PEP_ID=MMETSP1103-20130426/24704_1 /TAXON_ID=36769 /ORGANISM="Paraphysomonas bandaiensis, Strain Caron Lab Isolate" /LENGTH=667 /DNA_ID=CAMNT_0027571381 /DNA_START=134 /DNA_END=2137 /DNA_ORIENTATION=+
MNTIIPKQDKYFSSDEEQWECSYQPVINLFSCGWMEDGRCGYMNDPPTNSYIQLCPRPVSGIYRPIDTKGRQYVCKKSSAGSRHTILLMINYIPEKGRFGRKSKKIMFFGLNQGMLCEEEGVLTPEDVEWDEEEPPIDVIAGYGNCFVITKSGNVYSFGLGKFGILGHGDDETWQIPRQIMSLQRQRVKQVALGKFHALCLTYNGKLYSWGRNDQGQLGRGHVSRMEVEPDLAAEINTERDCVLEVACGVAHSLAIVRVKRRDNSVNDCVYGWGAHEQGQLSSADIRFSSKPQHLRWVMKYLEKYSYKPLHIVCGGYHNMLLFLPARQIVVWGAGEYGQLGDGFAWDNPKPQVVPNVKNVIQMSAGMRHSVAVAGVGGTDGIPEVWVWGDNSYGQLGLGDTDIRLQPVLLTACRRMRVTSVSAGDRHTLFVTSHKPLLVRDQPMLRDFFKILEEGGSKLIRHRLKLELKRHGMDPSLLDNPDKVMEGQAGKTDEEIPNEDFEEGLKYCMDTREQIPQLMWRRKGLECAYECPALGLTAVCMACARRCVRSRKLVLYLRKRKDRTDTCDCRTSGNCTCAWTAVREKIDSVIERKRDDGLPCDGCVGPDTVRKVLVALRAPIPVDSGDVEECLIALANGEENTHLPRIPAHIFEKWYRQHYQEYEQDDA